jgi:predicted nuclease of predicted toxin-antitoxin system
MASAIKLYLDEHVDPDVAKALRRHEIDVLTTKEASMLKAKDEGQFEFAVNHGRAIFTQDRDFLQHVYTSAAHAGIIYAPQGTPIGDIIEDLYLIATVVDQEELISRSPWFLPLP